MRQHPDPVFTAPLLALPYSKEVLSAKQPQHRCAMLPCCNSWSLRPCSRGALPDRSRATLCASAFLQCQCFFHQRLSAFKADTCQAIVPFCRPMTSCEYTTFVMTVERGCLPASYVQSMGVTACLDKPAPAPDSLGARCSYSTYLRTCCVGLCHGLMQMLGIRYIERTSRRAKVQPNTGAPRAARMGHNADPV